MFRGRVWGKRKGRVCPARGIREHLPCPRACPCRTGNTRRTWWQDDWQVWFCRCRDGGTPKAIARARARGGWQHAGGPGITDCRAGFLMIPGDDSFSGNYEVCPGGKACRMISGFTWAGASCRVRVGAVASGIPAAARIPVSRVSRVRGMVIPAAGFPGALACCFAA
jgi:hypothetical protein